MKNSTNFEKDLSLEENFNFINSYLNVISTIVKKYRGFIDKYFGDGIIAVFSEAEFSIECAHEINRAIENKNHSSKFANVEAKMAINFDEVVMGIMGDEDRKVPTIISNITDIGSNLQKINSYIGSKLLFTKNVLNVLPSKFKIYYRYVGSLNTKKNSSLPLFESIETYPREKREKLIQNKTQFEAGVQFYNEGDFAQAQTVLGQVLKNVSDDMACYIYYNKACEKIQYD